jgi:[acyl-carrier-protein] S-malonyltransferase
MTDAAMISYVFPGQASQEVGMGLDLYQDYPLAREIFDQADDVLGYSLSSLCFAGPEDELTKTVNVQPAIVAHSIACLKVVQQCDIGLCAPSFMAGHSLGEYTALVAAGALEFGDALKLVRGRGRLMYEAGKRKPGGMLAIIGSELKLVAEICSSSGCNISNDNCPGQIVISGAMDALNEARILAKEKGIRHIIPLKVSGAFHSTLMEPILTEFQQLLSNFTFHTPSCPIISNVTAKPIVEVAAIREELVKQLYCAIQWQSSVKYMLDNGVSIFYEIGPGKVLSGLIKRIDQQSKVFNISGSETIAQLRKLPENG